MTIVNKTISKDFWQTCTICHDELDGTSEHGGAVAISQRCFHVFHQTCIEPWLKDKKDDCPNCKLRFFEAWELIPNPEYSEEYTKWKADPKNYSLEKAFEERYGNIEDFENASFEEVTKPKDLIGKKPLRELTTNAMWERFHNKNAKIQELEEDASPEVVNKVMREAYAIHDETLNYLEEENRQHFADFAEVRKNNVEMNHILDESEAKTAHMRFICSYEEKAKALDKRKETEIERLKTLRPAPHDKIKKLRELGIRKYVGMFIDTHNIPDRESAKRRVLEIDAELEAFIASLPEDIQAILRPIEPEIVIVITPPKELPILPEHKPQRPRAPNNRPFPHNLLTAKAGIITSIVLSILGGGTYYGIDLAKAYNLAKDNVFFCSQVLLQPISSKEWTL